jgi:hypothetical protein
VTDPYDDISPHHFWELELTGDQMRSRLSGLYQGEFEGITIVDRCIDAGHFSGRIFHARINGSAGSTPVTGETLRSRLGLRSTWASFAKV